MTFKTLILAAILSGTTVAAPADAVSFHYWDTGAFENEAARKSFDVALKYWGSVLSDDVTVNLMIGRDAISAGELTQSRATLSSATVATVDWTYRALAADSSSALDAQAVANLPTLSASAVYPEFKALTVVANGLNTAGTGYVDETTRVDADGSTNNVLVSLNLATAKAIGLEAISGTVIDDTIVDALIWFSSEAVFDYDPTDGIAAGAYDFTGLAIREIGLALGLDSLNKEYDSTTTVSGDSVPDSENVEGALTAKPLDLFRYGGSDMLDWSTSEGDKFFSVDGGKTQLFGSSRFRTGYTNGDGGLASHWADRADGQSGGIMDSDTPAGVGMAVSALDLAAVDVIGWDLKFDILADPGYRRTTADIFAAMTAVPEPSTWLQMLAGFGLIGGIARRRRRGVAVVV